MTRSSRPGFARALVRDGRGSVTVEFALAASFLIFATLNAVELGLYLHRKSQVETSAQMVALAAVQACDPSEQPVSVYCDDLAPALDRAFRGTSLGARGLLSVTYQEQFGCVDATGTLRIVGNADDRPSSCASIGSPDASPGDYLTVTTSHTYSPLAAGIGVAAILRPAINGTAMVRVG